MVISQALLQATRQLKAALCDTPRLDANVLMQHVLGCDRMALLVRQSQVLSEAELADYNALVSRRAGGEPTAYLTGKKEFMSLEFSLSPAVLIPRPDTEILCEAVLEAAKKYPSAQILDLCCGSGCIGVSLAYFLPTAHVTLADISEDALAVAAQNARVHAPENTTVVRADALALSGTYDIIVSNPPYIESAVIDGLQREVRDCEPRLALDGGADGLVFYTHYARHMKENLTEGGLLALEVGHTQAQTVAALLRQNDWSQVQILCDLAGIERVVLACNK